MKPYVLGIKNNPILLQYLSKYEDLLLKKMKELVNDIEVWKYISYIVDNVDKEDLRNYYIHPDVSSIVNALYNKHIWKVDSQIDYIWYKNILIEDIKAFQNGWILIQNKWKKIPGTNILLSTDVANPFGDKWAHPDHKKNWGQIGYWEKNEEDWLNIYKKTFELLKKVDEWFNDELNYIIKKIIPFGTAYSLHNSASYKETIGALYMWYTIDSQYPEINNLEAIIHESSHNKLNLIMQFDDIILNNYDLKYYSPYRPDARHIHWIYLWVHAFAPTMYILAKAYNEWTIPDTPLWREKIVLYHIKNKISIKVLLKYAKLTQLWTKILNEINEVIKMTNIYIWKMNLSENEIHQVSLIAKQHFNEVNLNYRHLEY